MRTRAFTCILATLSSFACAAHDEPSETIAIESEALTPVQICNQDPRVNSGLVPLQVCAGARVFFDETFNGNGRSCGTCHAAANNMTIDKPFVDSLPANDPLFVNEDPAFNANPNPALNLAGLETPDLRARALIKENVDGFENNEFKFVLRSTPHTLSLATSITRDPGDFTSSAFAQRVGWSGDGSPGGTLRNFIDGAIKQHYPKDLSRTPGVSFRFATETEKDQVLAFQLALGRTADLNINNVTMSDAGAQAGRGDFINPQRGRCNQCHSNAGANFLTTGKNRQFDTNIVRVPPIAVTQPDGSELFDGGFGGQGLTQPNFAALPPPPATTGPLNSFGDGTFSVPPLIEAPDTAPMFHTGEFQSLESVISFYGSDLFRTSPAAEKMRQLFGGTDIDVSGLAVPNIGRFLRVLNASFNLAIASQRLTASRSLNIAYWAYRDDIQKGLIRLAKEEVQDAVMVLSGAAGGPLHATQQTELQNVMTLLTQAEAATDPAVRRDKTTQALTKVNTVKAAFGSGMNFAMGTGNLMF